MKKYWLTSFGGIPSYQQGVSEPRERIGDTNFMSSLPESQKTRVLHLKGTDRAIGAAHAEALNEFTSQGMLRFYFEFWTRVSNQTPDHQIGKWLHRCARYLLDPILVDKLARQIPEVYQQRIRGFCENGEHQWRQMITNAVLPDLFPLLQAYAAKWVPEQFVPVKQPPLFGCSSFIAKGKHFLHGRNLDFPGVNYWDRFPVLQMTERPNCLRYIGVTSAGIPLCGITGVNEAQLSVSLHQHYGRRVFLRGQLPFVIAEEVLSKASTIEQAHKMIRQAKVATAWAFVVTDGKTRQAFIHETNAGVSATRWLTDADPSLTHSNYFTSQNCRVHEYAASGRMNWDNVSRSNRLKQLVKESGYRLSAQKACKIISDHVDPFWEEEKTVNRTVSQVYNIQSVVFDTEKMDLYVCEGNSPIHLGSFVRFDLGEIFAGNEGRSQQTHEAYRFKDEKLGNAKCDFIKSFVHAMDFEFERADEALDQSLESAFVPEAAFTSAVIKLKLNDYKAGKNRLEEAIGTLENKIREKQKLQLPPEYFECIFFLGRTYDLLGERAHALQCYRRVASDKMMQDSNLRKRALAEPLYSADKLSRIMVPYSTYVPFQ